MNFKTVLLAFISITYTHDTLPFITQVDTIRTTEQKRIIFLADAHEKSFAEKDQTCCLIDFLQQNKESGFHILIEQAAPIDKLQASEYEILFRLDEHIQQAEPPLTHVLLENIEIRHVMTAAYSILKCKEPSLYNKYRDFKVSDAQKTIGSITFQDIIDEFNTNKESLSDYYANHTNEALVTIYKNHMDIVNEYFEQFQQKLRSISSVTIPVLDYAKTAYSHNLLEANDALAETISDTFLHLLDLHIVRTILTSHRDTIIVVAGRAHTSKILFMFKYLKASSVYNRSSISIEEITEEDGSTTQILHKQPVSANKITKGLMTQSLPPVTTNYAIPSIMCCEIF